MRSELTACAAALVFLMAVGGAPPAIAQGFVERYSMSRDEIVAAFVDRQLSGVYPSGLPWSELIRRDGTSDYRERGNRHEGRWWMRGRHFCFRYDLPMSGGCFRVVRIGANCYELYAVSQDDEATPAPNADGHWNGRMWREEATPTCEERPTS